MLKKKRGCAVEGFGVRGYIVLRRAQERASFPLTPNLIPIRFKNYRSLTLPAQSRERQRPMFHNYLKAIWYDFQ
ncbi:MAG: hypothetical protein BWK80_45865 [Desulfobacteraceae bacterium IS3]|nr:MAG: hypothetical protein BWK80_45865 [Desulfobacteraceae bacterium IS3]